MSESPSIEIEQLLNEANKAYNDQDSKTVQTNCDRIIKLDPENESAWLLLAKYGAWDSKMYDYDADQIIAYTHRAIGLVGESERQEKASDIYMARKHQIAALLEADMMMPSYTGAKKLHGTMTYWMRLLSEIPCLPADLIEAELTLCDNLCLRSKMAIMPGDRLVYTAYSSLNKKEPYGATFRRALASRLDSERAGNEQARVRLAQQALALVKESQKRLNELDANASKEKTAALLHDLNSLEEAVTELEGLTSKSMLAHQIEELNRQRAALKPMKIFKKKDLDTRIAEHKAQIASIDTDLEPVLKPIKKQIQAIKQALNI